MNLVELLEPHKPILTEGAVAERLRRHPGVELHPTLFNTPLIYGPAEAREVMVGIYREYLQVAASAGLPMLLTAPTWRLDAERIGQTEFGMELNRDAVAFSIEVRDGFSSPAPVLVGALLGPQGDCYRSELAPGSADAERFHRQQVTLLAGTGADFLQAQTLPAVEEARGLARVMASTGRPYIISFCTGIDGRVLDGTPLDEAMESLDAEASLAAPPAGYYVNCTHPRFITDAYPKGRLERLIGIQANGSSRDVTCLDGADATEADPVDSWAREMARLHRTHGVFVLGGCCGTTTAHLQALAELVV